MTTFENQNGHREPDAIGEIVNGQMHIGSGEAWPVNGHSDMIGPTEGIDEGHRSLPREPLSADEFGLIYPGLTLNKAQELAQRAQERYLQEKEEYLKTLGQTAAQGIEANDS